MSDKYGRLVASHRGCLAAKVKLSELRNVECVRAGFLTYQYTGSSADLVYSRYALHHLPDFWKAVGYICRRI